MPIVPLAVKKYFIDNIPVEETIQNHQDIYDFCMAQKVGKKFDVFFDFMENGKLYTNEMQDTNRYYIGKRGGRLYKKKPNGERETNLVSGEPVCILNDVHDSNAGLYNIKYDYYIKEANKIISQFNYKQTDLFICG